MLISRRTMPITSRSLTVQAAATMLTLFAGASAALAVQSVARQWNEDMLNAIRRDFARPTIHARNLFHVSIAMYDGWAIYDNVARTYLIQEHATAGNIDAARKESISFAAYRVLRQRFASSPGAAISMPSFDARMTTLGYDRNFTSTVGNSPAAIGNRIGAMVIAFGLADGSNEQGGYAATNGYQPINSPLVVALSGNPNMFFPNRWQPLALSFFIDQGGNVIPGGFPPFISPHWGHVTPFALTPADMNPPFVYHDPGPPPLLGGEGDAEFKSMFLEDVRFSSMLTPDDGVMIDISPASRGNNTLGTNDGHGRPLNPVTGIPYTPQIVKRGDHGRVLAEFWADGPSSETPPGHWNTIVNYVEDYPGFERRVGGIGPVLPALEWDVKAYLVLNGALHDAAVAAWGIKGYYDSSRPISTIRYMCDRGQSSDPNGPSYHPSGIPLEPGLVEVITPQSCQPGERHELLASYVGEIAVRSWPGSPPDPQTEYSGVRWMRGREWLPYQRPTFVTPPFAGYVSGHSTYSRAAAEVLLRLTGTEYFPGGMGQFYAPANHYLVFEVGPSEDVTMQWATYFDAADEAGISRLWGGIHPRADDFAGRRLGRTVGIAAYDYALTYFYNSHTCTHPGDVNNDGAVDGDDVAGFVRAKMGYPPVAGENPPCADFGHGNVPDDTAAFVAALLN